MQTIFVGEGTDVQQNPEYWRQRKQYWLDAAKRQPSKVLRKRYEKCAGGYDMLLNGTAAYRDDGTVESVLSTE